MTTGCMCASCARGLAPEPRGRCQGCQIDGTDSALARTLMRLREVITDGPGWDTRRDAQNEAER